MSEIQELYKTKSTSDNHQDTNLEIYTESTESNQNDNSETSRENKSSDNKEESFEFLLKQQEKKRKKYLAGFAIIPIISAFALHYLFNLLGSNDFSIIVLSVFLLVFILYKIAFKSNSEFYKTKILPQIIRQATEGYNIDSRIRFNDDEISIDNVEEFNSNELFSYCNNAEIEDSFYGKMNNVDFLFRELFLIYKARKSSDTLFKGINIRIQFNDIVASRTLFNMKTSIFENNKYKKIKTNDKNLNNLYSIYTNDFEGTSQMLTAKFRDKLIKLAQAADELTEDSTGEIRILANLNVLDIYIPCGINLFESSFFTKMTLEKIEEEKHKIKVFLDIIEMFTTNVKYLSSEE